MSETQEPDRRKGGRMVYDSEVIAMHDMAEALEGFAASAQQRILQYLCDRYALDTVEPVRYRITCAEKEVLHGSET